jgi:molybdenum cofactor synthesis domain-containing protein
MLTEKLQFLGAEIDPPVVIPDERDVLIKTLCQLTDDDRILTDDDRIDLIITTGGTGLSPRDITPDATREVIDMDIPGFSELMRYEGGKQTLRAYLSRGIAGVRGRSLIINLPGSERGAMHSLEVLMPLIPHALETIRGEAHECGSKIGEKDQVHTHDRS